jgi:tight adherence protein B
MQILFLFFGGLLIIGLVAGVVLMRGGGEGQVLDQRMKEQFDASLAPITVDGAPDQAPTTSSLQTMREQMLRRMDNMFADRGFAGTMRSQLRKADLKLTVTEFLLIHLVAAIVGAALPLLLGRAMLAPIGGIVGLFVPRFYVSFIRNRRFNQFNDQLPDVLGLWVNSLRAGYSVQQAMEAVARDAPPPASTEFRRVVSEVAIGVPIDIALNNMLSRMESEDLDLVFTAVNIQREVGGNLADILDTISHTIRERVRIKGEIRVITSSGRITGTVIGLLPVLFSVLMMAISPEYMGQLFYGSAHGGQDIPGIGIPCGWPLVALMLIMMSIGMAIIRRIVDIEV